MKIHETTTPSGALSDVFLRTSNDALALVNDEGTFALPEGGLEAVMARFGEPFDPASSVTVVGTLDLGGGASLRHVRHLAAYDVIARAFLVYEVAGHEPVCALATTVAAALDHLGRANGRAG